MRLVLLVSLLLVSSCITQKRCLERYPPQSVVETVVVYRDTIIPVYLPLSAPKTIQTYLNFSLVDIPLIRMPGLMRNKYTSKDTLKASSGLAYAEAWVERDVLKLKVWQTDTTIQVKLDSAIVQRNRYEKEVHILKEKYVPKIYKDALGICIFLFVGAAVWIGFKIRKIFI
jgi:hypothetical protein